MVSQGGIVTESPAFVMYVNWLKEPDILAKIEYNLRIGVQCADKMIDDQGRRAIYG